MNPAVEYEIPSDEAIALMTHLFNLRDRLGIPKTVTEADCTPSVWTFISEIVRVWKIGYPEEYQEWREGLDFQLALERSVRDSIKGGGHTSISYPERLYMLFKVFLPKIHYNNKSFTRPFLARLPEFKRTNFVQ